MHPLLKSAKAAHLFILLLLTAAFLLGTTECQATTFHSIQFAKTFISGSDGEKLPEFAKNPDLLKAATVQEMTIKKGDAIIFENRDTVVHNLFTKFFDLRVQLVGQKSDPIVFSEAGDFVVNCAIHPRMKLKVKVEN